MAKPYVRGSTKKKASFKVSQWKIVASKCVGGEASDFVFIVGLDISSYGLPSSRCSHSTRHILKCPRPQFALICCGIILSERHALLLSTSWAVLTRSKPSQSAYVAGGSPGKPRRAWLGGAYPFGFQRQIESRKAQPDCSGPLQSRCNEPRTGRCRTSS